MNAVRARLRAELRARWRSWFALALAIGLAGGVVLTAAAGARRTGTAFSRFLAENRAEDVYIAGVSPGDPQAAPLYHELERLPQVALAGGVAAMILAPPNGLLSTPYHFAGIDARYGNTIDRPNVVAGRRPHPDRAEEVLINREMARGRNLHVGSAVDWVSLVPPPEDDPTGAPEARTPVHLRVVGIGVYPNEVVPTAQYDSLQFLYLTPAFFRAHPSATQGYGFEVIRLRNGKDDVAAFRAGMNKLLPKYGAGVHDFLFSDRAERNAQVRRAIQPQALALGLFAVLAGVASLLVIGQVLARQIFLDSSDFPALRALGLSRGQLVAGSMARVGAIALAGAAIAFVVAALASPLMPVGPARLAEPHPGLAANVAILAAGFVAIVLLTMAVALLPAWRAATAPGRDVRTAGRAGLDRRPGVLASLASAGFPPTAVIGVRAALRPGRGRTSVPVRSALVISGVAIAMVIAALTFTSNLDHLVHTPRLYGWNWDLKAGNGFFAVDVDAAMAKLRNEPDVEAVAGANYGEVRIAGSTIAAVGIDPLRGSVFPTLLEGRAPRRGDEIVLGTGTLRRAHLTVGDRATVSIDSSPRRMRIVGRAIFPKLGAGSFRPTNLGEGAATGAQAFADPSSPADRYTVLLIRLRAGADLAANRVRVTRDLRNMDFCGGDARCAAPAERPGDISNYTRVRGTSRALATALVLMAIGAIGHVLVTSVRRRRRDLAVLKTLGFVRGQVSAVTAWQATTMAAVALLIGLPIGIVLGRLAWRAFAEQLGVSAHLDTPFSALLLAVPATILLANVIAAVPAMLAARTRPAVVLRSE